MTFRKSGGRQLVVFLGFSKFFLSVCFFLDIFFYFLVQNFFFCSVLSWFFFVFIFCFLCFCYSLVFLAFLRLFLWASLFFLVFHGFLGIGKVVFRMQSFYQNNWLKLATRTGQNHCNRQCLLPTSYSVQLIREIHSCKDNPFI